MILFFYGDDSYRSRQYLQQSIAKFKRERDPQGYNVLHLDAKKIEASRLFAELHSVPFLSAKRMVIVENVLSNNDKELLEQVIQEVKNSKVPDSTAAIFYQSEPLSKVKEAKTLQALLAAEKYTQEFPTLAPDKLGAWIKKEMETRGGIINPVSITYIVENAGGDMWLIATLLDELRAYAEGRTIEPKDVALFLPKKLDDNIFSMIDALVAGNHKTAFTLLNEQRRLGQEDMQIFGLLVWQFRVLVELADADEREAGAPSDVLAKKTGLHPFVVKKNLAIIKKFPPERFRQRYAQLLAIDRQTKTGQADPGLLIDRFVTT